MPTREVRQRRYRWEGTEGDKGVQGNPGTDRGRPRTKQAGEAVAKADHGLTERSWLDERPEAGRLAQTLLFRSQQSDLSRMNVSKSLHAKFTQLPQGSERLRVN